MISDVCHRHRIRQMRHTYGVPPFLKVIGSWGVNRFSHLPFCLIPHPQGKHEFVNDVASLWELSSEEEIHHFQNESLGMALLHLCHLALRHGVPLEKVAKKTRYLGMGRGRCIGRWTCPDI